VQRDGEEIELSITPRTEWPEDSGPMGVALSNPFVAPKSWFSTLPVSFQATGRDIGNLLSLPVKLIAGTASPEEGQLAGPRSIWNIFQAAVASDVQSRQDASRGGAQPTFYTLLVIIGLSVSVGTINILPIPAFDGGRILFILPELLFRRSIPVKYQAVINGSALILLVALMVFFYIKDFLNPITITFP
jgi:regulator of sigma E protease